MAGRRVNKKTKRKKKRIGTMDLILLLVFICLVIFTVMGDLMRSAVTGAANICGP